MPTRRFTLFTLSMLVVLAVLMILVAPVTVTTAQVARRTPARTISAPNIQITPPDVELPDINVPDFNLPEELSPLLAEIPMPEDLPSLDELAAYASDLTAYADEMAVYIQQLEAMLSGMDYSVDSLTAYLEPSPEAYALIVEFANAQLGKQVAPIYAGLLDSDAVVPEEYEMLVDMALALFVPDVQGILTMAADVSADGYWALFPDGVAVVYGVDCEQLDFCPVGMGTLQLQINFGSIGAYGFYTSRMPGNETDAMMAVLAAFPALEGYTLESWNAGIGYAFAGSNINLETTTVAPTAVVAGIFEVEGLPFVYAMVAVGEGYVGLTP